MYSETDSGLRYRHPEKTHVQSHDSGGHSVDQHMIQAQQNAATLRSSVHVMSATDSRMDGKWYTILEKLDQSIIENTNYLKKNANAQIEQDEDEDDLTIPHNQVG